MLDVKETDHKKEHEMIGLRIAYYRKMKKMTQKDVADKFEVDYTHISKIERAVVGVSIDTLLDLAEIIGVPAYKFLDFSDLIE